MTNEQIIEAGRHVLDAEAQALRTMREGLDENFARAAEILFSAERKVVISGVGKSGLIGQKIAATLCSTGTPAIFLHSADAVHGDLGICQPGDPVVLISKSGTTSEVVRLLPILRKMGAKIIAIVANRNSPLAEKADVVLDIGVRTEADPIGIVPTTSTTLQLAMGDALASALMHMRHFGERDFAKFHPAGQLGRNLLLTVKDVMHPRDKIAVVPASTARADFVPEKNVIAGNTLLYGATSGEVFIRGQVGERFCVRNSGASAVVEGVGDHACEYMTGGRVVVLGETGRNFAAGMSGGIAYVYDTRGDFDYFCNMDSVELTLLETSEDEREVRSLLEKHVAATGSLLARRILGAWETERSRFLRVLPTEYAALLARRPA